MKLNRVTIPTSRAECPLVSIVVRRDVDSIGLRNSCRSSTGYSVPAGRHLARAVPVSQILAAVDVSAAHWATFARRRRCEPGKRSPEFRGVFERSGAPSSAIKLKFVAVYLRVRILSSRFGFRAARRVKFARASRYVRFIENLEQSSRRNGNEGRELSDEFAA